MSRQLKRAAKITQKTKESRQNPHKKGVPKTKTISEFRSISRNSKNFAGHPVYAYNKIGEDFKVLVITHDKNNSNSSKVKKLDKNPSPKDTQKAKIHKKARIINKNLCGSRHKKWFFKTNNDKKKVKEIIENNKNKKLERIE